MDSPALLPDLLLKWVPGETTGKRSPVRMIRWAYKEWVGGTRTLSRKPWPLVISGLLWNRLLIPNAYFPLSLHTHPILYREFREQLARRIWWSFLSCVWGLSQTGCNAGRKQVWFFCQSYKCNCSVTIIQLTTNIWEILMVLFLKKKITDLLLLHTTLSVLQMLLNTARDGFNSTFNTLTLLSYLNFLWVKCFSLSDDIYIFFHFSCPDLNFKLISWWTVGIKLVKHLR